MFEKIKMPLLKGLAATVLTFTILSFQNCAKPLDDISSNNSSLSSIGASCSLTLSNTSVFVGSPLAINYSYTPTTAGLNLIITNNETAAYTENKYIQDGSTNYINNIAGNYTILGQVMNVDNTVLATCQKVFTIKSAPTIPNEPPPPVMPTITLSGDKTSCVGSCTLNLTHNTPDIASSGMAFRIMKLNGSTTKAIACRTTNGIVTTPVNLSYAVEPGLNSFIAYFVSTCTTSTAGAQASATFNVTINPTANTYTYAWVASTWGICNAACDDVGTQSRSVVCKRNDGVTVANTYCTSVKPATSQTCYGRACGPSCAIGTVCP